MSQRRVPRGELTSAHPAPLGDVKGPSDASDQDDEFHLPPLDDDDDDDTATPEAELEETLASLEEESADPYDDATASDLETGLDVGIEDSSAREDDDAAGEGVDVGALDEGMSVRDTYGDGSDEKAEGGAEDEDFEISPDTRGEDDGGAEGMDDNAEDDVDEADLPGLDADEEGDFEGEDVVAEMTFEADSTLPAWDSLRWTALEGAGATVPCSALAVAAGRVAAGGEVVLLVNEGDHAARRTGFEGGASSVAITEEAAVVVAHRGLLWISKDEGKTAGALVGWRGSKDAVKLAATPGRIWILSEGSLWSMPSTGGQATQARAKDVRRIAATGAAVVALTRTATGTAIERLRGDDEGWQATPVEGPAQSVAESDEVELAAAAGGRLIALTDGESVCVSRDGGVTFAVVHMPEVAALAFAGEDEGAPLLALLAREVDASACVALVPAVGAPTRIAELPGGAGDAAADDDDGAAFGAAAMGWDASREVAWVACRAGLLALTRARKH